MSWRKNLGFSGLELLIVFLLEGDLDSFCADLGELSGLVLCCPCLLPFGDNLKDLRKLENELFDVSSFTAVLFLSSFFSSSASNCFAFCAFWTSVKVRLYSFLIDSAACCEEDDTVLLFGMTTPLALVAWGFSGGVLKELSCCFATETSNAWWLVDALGTHMRGRDNRGEAVVLSSLVGSSFDLGEWEEAILYEEDGGLPWVGGSRSEMAGSDIWSYCRPLFRTGGLWTETTRSSQNWNVNWNHTYGTLCLISLNTTKTRTANTHLLHA